MKPLFLVFEPVNHAYKVIEAAARRGFEVHVFHTIDFPSFGPYCAAVAAIDHAHRVKDWLDADALLQQVIAVCEGRRVVGTYALPEAILEFNARVQQHFGLPGHPPELVRRVLDKRAVRALLRERGLSTLRSMSQAEAEALDAWPDGGQAFFFKPVHGTNSAYVFRCTSLEDLHRCQARWAEAMLIQSAVINAHLHSGAGYFLEQEAPGELMSVESYLHEGSFHPIGIMSRTLLARDPVVEMGSSFPYPRSDASHIHEQVRRIHEALGLRNGFTHTEIIVDADGRVELVELNIRFAGSDAMLLVSAALGIRMEDELLKAAIGERAHPVADPQASSVAVMQFLLPRMGEPRIESIEMPEAQLAMARSYVKPGTELRSTEFETDIIGSFIVTAPSYPAAIQSASSVRSLVLLNGRPMGSDVNNVVHMR